MVEAVKAAEERALHRADLSQVLGALHLARPFVAMELTAAGEREGPDQGPVASVRRDVDRDVI